MKYNTFKMGMHYTIQQNIIKLPITTKFKRYVATNVLPFSSCGKRTFVRIWRPLPGWTSTWTGTLGFDWFGLIHSASSWVRFRRVIGKKGILKTKLAFNTTKLHFVSCTLSRRPGSKISGSTPVLETSHHPWIRRYNNVQFVHPSLSQNKQRIFSADL